MEESTFDSGKDEIRDRLKPLLTNVARVLEDEASEIIIAGHTDNVPIRGGPYQSNLSERGREENRRVEIILSNLPVAAHKTRE